MIYQDIIIVTLAYEPDERLLEPLENTRDKGSHTFDIVLVDDDNRVKFASLFVAAQDNYAYHLQRHAENKGKGRALKTAIPYILDNLPNTKGIVMISSDDQRTYEDMMKCLAEFLQHPDSLVLGVRIFEKSAPLRSKFGNLLTRDVLGAMADMNVSDTQTGLRMIPMSWLPKLLNVEGERYEFETNILLRAEGDSISVCEAGIATIYLDESQSSHFDVVRDSIRIYKVFFKYIFPSLFSSLVDIVAFAILISLLNGLSFSAVTLASILTRTIPFVVNLILDHKMAFKQSQSSNAIKYFTLVIVQITLLSLLVTVLGSVLAILPISVVKISAGGTLFFVNYFVQKHLILSGDENKNQ